MFEKAKRKAFTIIELIVVFATLAFLFVAVVSKFDVGTNKAKLSAVQTDFRAFYVASQQIAFNVANPADMTEEQFENMLNSNLDSSKEFEGRESSQKDPWGNKYRYATAVVNDKFCVIFASQGGTEEQRFTTSDMGLMSDAEAFSFSNTFVPRLTLSFAIVAGDIYALEESEHEILKNHVADLDLPISGSLNDIEVLEGNPFTFYALTRGDTSGMTYKWFRNGEELTGETSPSLTMIADMAYNDNRFMCEITKNGKTYETNAATLTVIPSVFTNLAIKTMPVKTEYFAGQDFSPVGLTLEASYSNGSKVLIDSYTIERGTNLSVGQSTVTAVWGSYSLEVPISVISESTIGLKIVALPSRTNYVETQNLDPAGLIVAIEYNNGSKETITDYTLSGGTRLKPGTQRITVSARGYSASFNVNVTPMQVIKLDVLSQPTKTRYLVNTNFDKAGLVVQATWNTGLVKTVTNDSGTTSNGAGYTPITNGYTITNGTRLQETQTSVTLKMDNATVSVPIEVYVHEHTGQPGQTYANGCYTKPVESGGYCRGYQKKHTWHGCSCGSSWPCRRPDEQTEYPHGEVYKDYYSTEYHSSKGSCSEWTVIYTYYMDCGYPLEP